MTETPQVRMDKSRTFSTIHGDRLDGDAHQFVHFYQDGLPFDAKGILIPDHPDVLKDPKLQALAERKMEKAAKSKPVARKPEADGLAGDDVDETEDGDVDGDDDGAGDDDPINLTDWAQGKQKLEWQLVTNAIAQRFHVRVGSKTHAIELLLKEGVVSKGDLSGEHAKLVRHLD